MTIPIFFLGGFGIASLGGWAISRFAVPLGLVDFPNARSSHSAPTPRSGGIGIALAFAGAAVFLKLSPGFWGPAAGMALLGFCDDRFDLSAGRRLFAQFLLAFLMALFLLGLRGAPWYLLPVAVLYIVGTTNFYNFMDGINGIAGFSGAVGFSLLALFAVMSTGGGRSMVSLMLCMTGACIGFLPFNFPRASVFMGDVGSLLLGTVFSASVLHLSSDLGDFLVLSGFMLPFYADTVSTLIMRWRSGENILEAHRKHLYQILANELKVPHWRVTLLYGGCQLLAGLLMLAAADLVWWIQVLMIVVLTSIFIFVSLRLRRVAGTPDPA